METRIKKVPERQLCITWRKPNITGLLPETKEEDRQRVRNLGLAKMYTNNPKWDIVASEQRKQFILQEHQEIQQKKKNPLQILFNKAWHSLTVKTITYEDLELMPQNNTKIAYTKNNLTKAQISYLESKGYKFTYLPECNQLQVELSS